MNTTQLTEAIVAHRAKLDNLPDDADLGEWQREWNRLNVEFDRAAVAEGGIRSRIGRDGGTLAAGPVNRQMFGGGDDAEDLAIAGWLRNQAGIPVSAAEAEAVRTAGFALNSGAFNIGLPERRPTRAVNRNQGIYSGQTFQPMNALSAYGGPAGGYTVPAGFVASLERAMLAYGGMLQTSDVMITPDGRSMPWPTSDDTSNEGALIGESQESEEQDVAFGQVTFDAYKLTSKLVKVPFELLEDSALNIGEELGAILGERIGRTANRLWTTGTGDAQPYGIVPQATLGKTAANSTAISFDELIELVHSVDPAYRSPGMGAGFMMHDSVVEVIRKLKDGNGDYIWQDSVQAGQPDRLLGYPVTINQNMSDSLTSGEKVVLFGQLNKYKIRQVGQIRLVTLNERFAEYDQVGFLAFHRIDGCLLDAGTNPVKYLQLA